VSESMSALLDRIRSIVGPTGLIIGPQELAPYATDWRKTLPRQTRLRSFGPSPRPKSRKSSVPAWTPELAIVPQGGNTGLCGRLRTICEPLASGVARRRRARYFPLEGRLQFGRPKQARTTWRDFGRGDGPNDRKRFA